ncbi:MAG: hypothetical protein A2V90_06695 [Gammaproteobacteria bacterium RBG_16_57_12]|nr:MAG: hypothetical protein A2V90_06695 [Gammaproteobacteria bacterium RBG_16_57_12]
MYRYQFTSTVEDLLEAEEAERSSRSVRAPFRWVAVAFGVTWLVIGIVAFDFTKLSWRPIVWILLGIGILYFFAIKPYLKRSRIKKNNAPRQDLTLEFGDDCLKFEISDVGNFTRRWEELAGFVDTDKGILFYFNDGIVNWIPNRVFADKAERDNFIEFLQSHQPPPTAPSPPSSANPTRASACRRP